MFKASLWGFGFEALGVEGLGVKAWILRFQNSGFSVRVNAQILGKKFSASWEDTGIYQPLVSHSGYNSCQDSRLQGFGYAI